MCSSREIIHSSREVVIYSLFSMWALIVLLVVWWSDGVKSRSYPAWFTVTVSRYLTDCGSETRHNMVDVLVLFLLCQTRYYLDQIRATGTCWFLLDSALYTSLFVFRFSFLSFFCFQLFYSLIFCSNCALVLILATVKFFSHNTENGGVECCT